jgi:phosphoenolpyruvate carboxykinase (GTP)
VAQTPDGDVWWEDMTDTAPPKLMSWTERAEWTPGAARRPRTPNARYTAPIAQCPIADPAYNDPKGVPISAILFGGRRPSTIPLVYQSLSWQHGVFLAPSRPPRPPPPPPAVGQVRRDPMAMLPFCGYNVGDYLAHWMIHGQIAPRPTSSRRSSS